MKGRIFYLEDDPEWIHHVQEMLGSDYEVYTASNVEDASLLFYEWKEDGWGFDLAIIDISLVLGDAHDKKGLGFVRLLEETGVMQGHSIIVLTGYSVVDQNLRVSFRDYDVVDVFDKGDFPEERPAFVRTVTETIKRLKD